MRIKKLILFLSLNAMLLGSGLSFADPIYRSESFENAGSVSIKVSDSKLALIYGLHVSRDAASTAFCSGSSFTGITLIKIDDGTVIDKGRELYATLLASKLAGKSVKLETDGCYGGHPVVQSVELE